MDQACAAVQLSWVLRKALALLSTLEVRPRAAGMGRPADMYPPRLGCLSLGRSLPSELDQSASLTAVESRNASQQAVPLLPV